MWAVVPLPRMIRNGMVLPPASAATRALVPEAEHMAAADYAKDYPNILLAPAGGRPHMTMQHADPKPLAAPAAPVAVTMLVDAQVLLMNTNRSGSRSS